MRDSRRTMEEFLTSVERRAFRMAQISTGNSEDALDIVQDTMFIWVRKYSEKPEEEWRPLFFRILQNKIRDWHRRNNVQKRWRLWLQPWRNSAEEETRPIEHLADPAIKDVGDQMILGHSMKALETSLNALPLRQQQAFLLRAWEEMNVRETAAVMGCSEGSVKTHYSRAVHALRNLLEDHRP
ncbi:DNA-directed RNA polymerase specialized sigma subunit, sigma24-like [hydrothermal vent metagenome]|uniref:DNA-directed RNA polymerase specialized sigma subunit, sigma24-like n=1 Tax=hydrothermal vent metagenome TaxID=652676 RepID=A0A3B1DTG4_9ZZZZ